MSSGVRLASAVPAMKKMRKPSGCFQMFQSRNDGPCIWTMAFRLIVPARMMIPTTDRVSGIS